VQVSPPGDERQAREEIDRLLTAAGWSICDANRVNLSASRGVAVREFPLPGHGAADYLLYVDGKAAGVIEAKKEGTTLTGVETQSAKYNHGLPKDLPAWDRPLPFAYESTGIETRFTNALNPTPRSRPVFAFHQPETLAEWLDVSAATRIADSEGKYDITGNTFLTRLAGKLDIDLLAAAFRKMDENEKKYPADTVRGSARKYTEYLEQG
jgi:type I restriction enzyme R subunit